MGRDEIHDRMQRAVARAGGMTRSLFRTARDEMRLPQPKPACSGHSRPFNTPLNEVPMVRRRRATCRRRSPPAAAGPGLDRQGEQNARRGCRGGRDRQPISPRGKIQ